jgi:hypothetical protein
MSSGCHICGFCDYELDLSICDICDRLACDSCCIAEKNEVGEWIVVCDDCDIERQKEKGGEA